MDGDVECGESAEDLTGHVAERRGVHLRKVSGRAAPRRTSTPAA